MAMPTVCPLWLADELPDPEPKTSSLPPVDDEVLEEPSLLSVPVEPDPSAPVPNVMPMAGLICDVMLNMRSSGLWYSLAAGCMICMLSVLTSSTG